jgi:hypothetical protein
VTTRLFVDTEFTDFIDCELLSIGIISDDGREFYGERDDVDWARCSDFTRVAVLPQLGLETAVIGSESHLGVRLKAWLEQFRSAAPVIVSVDYPMDWELFTYLVRDTENLTMPSWIKGQSIRNEIDPKDVERYWMENGRRAHHALHDARANRFAYLQHLARLGSLRV